MSRSTRSERRCDVAKQDTAGLALQWGWTDMGEFYIKVALPISIDGKTGYAPIIAFTLTEEEKDNLKASVNNKTRLTIAKQIPKSNGHKTTLLPGS